MNKTPRPLTFIQQQTMASNADLHPNRFVFTYKPPQCLLYVTDQRRQQNIHTCTHTHTHTHTHTYLYTYTHTHLCWRLLSFASRWCCYPLCFYLHGLLANRSVLGETGNRRYSTCFSYADRDSGCIPIQRLHPSKAIFEGQLCHNTA